MKHPFLYAIVCFSVVASVPGIHPLAACGRHWTSVATTSSPQGPIKVRKRNKRTSQFDPSGDYHPAKTQLTGPFKFIQFDLEVKHRKGKLVVLGEVNEVGRWFRFASVSISRNLLRFKTRSIEGVSYRFDGHFLAGGNFREPGEYSAILLKGKLEKFVKGRTIAALDGPWVYYPGC